MRVGIDLTALVGEPTGVDVALRQLVTALGALDHETRYTIFVNHEDRHAFAQTLPPNFALRPLALRARPVRLFFQQIMLPAAGLVLGLDVVHSPSFIMPMVRGRQRHVLTIHDMTFFSLPQYHLPLHQTAAFRRAVRWSIRRADLVTTPSRHVQRDVVAELPEVPAERVRVVEWGVGDEFRPRPPAEARAALSHLGLPASYVLFVGTIEPRKNLLGLVEAYQRLIARRNVAEHLVLAGRLGWNYDAILARITAPELRGRVHLPGYVRHADLPSLYAGASLFVYPSFAEGFGFPPLEAMACGVPVVASHSSALAENLDGAAILIPPGDSDALADAMRALLGDGGERARRREQGLARAARFRWSETARGLLACYRELGA